MNTRSLAIAIVAAFITVFATDSLIHQVWLAPTYGATKELWRPEAEIMSKMPWMVLGQFLVAAAFTTIFAACVAEKKCLSCTLKYAACIAVLVAAGQIIMYAVQPLPGSLIAKWCIAYLAQSLLLGFVVHKVYRLPVQ